MKERKEIILDLAELVDSKIDSISGRAFGQDYAQSKDVLKEVLKGSQIKMIIDPSKIKAINDSFFKGFFNKIFEELSTKEKVKSYFVFETNQYYKTLIEKNLIILDTIYNK